MSEAQWDELTVAEARELLRPLAQDGGHHCPLCRQLAKVYRRKIHTTMARALIRAYRHNGRAMAYLPDTLTHRENADWAKLVYWGLIEAEVDVRGDGSVRTGKWRVTDAGEHWIWRETWVPKYADIYDGRLLRLVGEPVSIIDALGARFDYGELMAA